MKVTVIEIKHYQLNNNLNKIRKYLKDIINALKKYDAYKVQLTMAIDFISSKYNDEERAMHSQSDNIESMIYDNADEVTKDLHESLLNRYQIGLETSIIGSDFILDCVHLLYYKCHKINLNHDGSYRGFPYWIKKPKTKNESYQ